MKNIVSKFYIVGAFLCSTAIMFAQPGDDSDDGLNGNDNQLPISDYLWVLALVGFVVVYFKLSAQIKNMEDED